MAGATVHLVTEALDAGPIVETLLPEDASLEGFDNMAEQLGLSPGLLDGYSKAARDVIADGIDAFEASAGFASNGYGDHSPAGYSLLAVIVAGMWAVAGVALVVYGGRGRRR